MFLTEEKIIRTRTGSLLHILTKKGIITLMDRVRQIINAETAYRRGYFGENIGVAVLDTGIFSHVDFGRRIVFFQDYVSGRRGTYDDNGHGTHIAGIIGGDGTASRGKYMGIAPACHFKIGRAHV